MSGFNILTQWLSKKLPGTELSRRAWLEIKCKSAGGGNTIDVSEDISRYFLSLSYTDNLDGEADDISLTLEDIANLWLKGFFPKDEGNTLELTIHTYNWHSLSEGEKTFPLGTFEIDEIEVNGFPSTVQIKAVSVVGDSSLRGTERNQSWEKVELKKIASDVAARNNLELIFDVDENPTIDRVEQSNQSDLEFLHKLCKDNGLSLKVSTEKLIIFDEYKYEKEKPVITIIKPGTTTKSNLIVLEALTDYKLKAKTRDTYQDCEVQYQNGKTKEIIQGTFSDSNKSNGRTLHVKEQVENADEANRLAKKKLREANKDAVTGSFSTLGDFNLMAGIVVELENFGVFDGKYIITKASHDISDSYKTSIEVRKCLDGY